MCTMWNVRYRSGMELMYPSDDMLLQLLDLDDNVIMVYERKSGKVLINKEEPKTGFFFNIIKRLRK